MGELLNIMINVISPIFMVIAVAYLIGKTFKPDISSISTLLIYLFAPALVFQGISNTEIPVGEMGGIALLGVGVALIMMVIAIGIARLQGYPPRTEGAFVLSVMLVNAANYGIPLNTFAFGEAGGQVAIVYYVVSALIGNVIGVFWASRGQVSTRDALLNILKVPVGYAAVIGLIFNLGDLSLPLPIERSVNVAASAAVPGMLALLGLNLARTTLRGRVRPIAIAVSTKLALAPIVALTLASLLGLTGVTYNVGIVESSMPKAVLATALATQFGSDAELVSAVTLVTTLASIVTLSLLIYALGGVTV